MRLYALLLLTVSSYSSASVMAQELPDHATAIEEIELLGGRIKPDKASPSQTGVSVSLCGCERFDDDNLKKAIPTLHVVSASDLTTEIRVINGETRMSISRKNGPQ